ncbi:hypothetical protein [Cellulomonas endophytica]|uniref:hypothetical protein n=1 Tax=Cellulomonas endophytica TaxID=2494735 RepID=UPI001013178F|nr:hypothetical protein [Cellulomonas endophytica]
MTELVLVTDDRLRVLFAQAVTVRTESACDDERAAAAVRLLQVAEELDRRRARRRRVAAVPTARGPGSLLRTPGGGVPVVAPPSGLSEP